MSLENNSMDLIVGGIPPVITSNFEELKTAIQARLAPYRIQVTEENLPECKKLAVELGKGATHLNSLKKEKSASFTAPIKAFEAQVMELVGMIQEGQDFLKKQVKVFEDQRRAVCETVMIAHLRGAYLTLSVKKEFQTGQPKIVEMVGISKITKDGVLTKSAADAIMALAISDRGLQDRVEGRLASLKIKSLEAGLEIPIAPEYVQTFIGLSDEEYAEKINEMILKAVSAEMQAKEKRKAKAEKDAEELAEKARAKVRIEEQEKARVEAQEVVKAEALAKEAKDKAIRGKEEAEKAAFAQNVKANDPTETFLLPKSLVVITVRIPIETTKTSDSDMENYHKYFIEALCNAKLPPFTIKITKETK